MPYVLRQSLRQLIKSPGATLAAVASLALGIGANTTVFSLIDAVVLRPLPSVHAERLVSISEAHDVTVSYPGYRQLAESVRTLDGLAAFASRMASLNLGDFSTVADVQVVSGNFFDVLGVKPARGRMLSPQDDAPGNEPVLVASAGFWQQSLGGDAAAVGRVVNVNGVPFRVIGIAPPGFRGATLGANPAGWITVNAWPRIATGLYRRLEINSTGWGWLRMVGRLAEGVDLSQARSELSALAPAALRDAGPDTPDIEITSLRAAATGLRSRADLTRFITLLVGLVMAVLAIACANVSGLLLARALSRRQELGIRVALGASRTRILRESMTDSVLLGAVGAICGVLTAMWTIDLLQRIQLPGGIDMSRVEVHVSGVALAATAALSVVAAFLFGLAPALQGTRDDVVSSLKDRPSGGTGSRQWLRGGLVAAQVTLSLVLLVGTALFARTLQTTLSADLGFDPDHVSYGATNVALQQYDDARAATFYQAALDRVRALPGMDAAGWTRLIPGGGEDEETISVPGYVTKSGRPPVAGVNLVTSGYFETMRIPILRGRAFSDEDAHLRAPVVIVSDTAARMFWNGDALGRRFSINNAEVTVIGVSRDVPAEPGVKPGPFVYGNVFQNITAAVGPMNLVVRGQRTAPDLVPQLTAALRTVAPEVPILEARPLRDQLLDVLGPQRSAVALLAMLSVIALVLSAGGIYAMVAFWVNQRTREFGVRMALGATAAKIRRLALVEAATAVLVGVALGLPIAVALGRASRSLLYQLSPTDPLSFAGATALILVVAVVASLIPAERAARIDPLKALRAGTE